MREAAEIDRGFCYGQDHPCIINPQKYSSISKPCPKRCSACLTNNGTSIKISSAVRIKTQEHRTADVVNNDRLRGEFKQRVPRKRTWRMNSREEDAFHTM